MAQYYVYKDGSEKYRDGVRGLYQVTDMVLTPTGFAGSENTDWINLDKKLIPIAPSGSPSNLTLALITGGVRITWTDNYDGETGSEIYVSVDGGATYSLLTSPAQGVFTYDDMTARTYAPIYYKVRATVGATKGNFCQPLSITTIRYSSGLIANDTPTLVTLTLGAALDTNSVPAPSAFTLSDGKTISNVAVSGSTVILTVTVAYTCLAGPTVSYTKPVSNPLKVLNGGGQIESFTAQTVRNKVEGTEMINQSTWRTSTYWDYNFIGFTNDGSALVCNTSAGTLTSGSTGNAPVVGRLYISRITIVYTSGTANFSYIAANASPNYLPRVSGTYTLEHTAAATYIRSFYTGTFGAGAKITAMSMKEIH